MNQIILRSEKGSELTFAEMDGNISELRTRTANGWNDLVSQVIIQGGSTPSWSNIRDGLYAFAFDQDVMNECFTVFHMNHDYIPGTMVYPHVHWTNGSSVATGTVRWGVEWAYARRGDSAGQVTFPASNTLYIEVNVDGTQYKHYVSESGEGNGIPGTTLDVDSVIICRFFRDAANGNDTYAFPAYLLTVDVHYESDTRATPFRFPPFH